MLLHAIAGSTTSTAGVPQGDDIVAGVTVRYGGGVAPALWADAATVRAG